MPSHPSSRRIRAVAAHVVAGAAAESETILPTPPGSCRHWASRSSQLATWAIPAILPRRTMDRSPCGAGSGWEDLRPILRQLRWASTISCQVASTYPGECSWMAWTRTRSQPTLQATNGTWFIADAADIPGCEDPEAGPARPRGRQNLVKRSTGCWAQQPIQKVTDTGCPDENHPPATDKVICIGRTGDGWKGVRDPHREHSQRYSVARDGSL